MIGLKTAFTAFLAIALTTGAAIAKDKKREVYKRGGIFQNVAVEHVRPLLANTARVSHFWDGQNTERGSYTRIVWHGADGREYGCLTDTKGKSGDAWSAVYAGRTIDLKGHKVRYPLKQKTHPNGDLGYQMLRYNGETGDLTIFIAANRKWWESDVGHLQARIPAVTWEICPDFPSAESLGAEVNTKQTSRYYNELVRQDPGQRILRPQFVNECAHEWYGRKARKNCQTGGGN